MKYDPSVPSELKHVQTWFGGVITQPIDSKSHIQPIAPSGRPISEEAKTYIASSPTLEPQERIELYNQQYWWRLLNTLHETFPLVTRLLGYHAFNDRVAMPYLTTFPSEHWSLNHLGDRLPLWIENHYKGGDKAILYDSARLDAAFNACFFEAHLPPITAGRNPEEAMATPARLQPHLFLFALEYDLPTFRSEIKKQEPDFWSSHHYPNLKHALSENGQHFPKLDRGEFFFIIYRAKDNRVLWDRLSETEYSLLEQFKKGLSIEQCCQKLEKSGGRLLSEAKGHLEQWIRKWVAREWLASG